MTKPSTGRYERDGQRKKERDKKSKLCSKRRPVGRGTASAARREQIREQHPDPNGPHTRFMAALL